MLFLSLCVVASLTFGFRFGKYHLYNKKRVRYLYQIENLDKFDNHTSRNKNLVEVFGNTSNIPVNHPVIDVVLKRWISNSKPGKRGIEDQNKIALCIEGGGMRGCVAAGSAAAINFLGLNDAIDSVYGSSAGAMVGTYFVSRQFGGVNIYHDILPAAGSQFIDKRKLLTAMGFPLKLSLSTKKIRKLLSHNTFRRIMNKISVIESTNIIPEKVDDSVFNLDYLLNTVMNGVQKLDWDSFSRNEQYQKLRIVTTSVTNMTSFILSRDNGNYYDTPSLLKCIRASMLVPGLTGDLMGMTNNIKTPFYLKERKSITEKFVCDEFVDNSEFLLSDNSNLLNSQIDLDYNEVFLTVNDWVEKKMLNSSDINNSNGTNLSNPLPTNEDNNNNNNEITPLVDAFICEPIPYRSAAAEGHTHIITLRTRPDPCPVLGKKPGVYERLIARRFFQKYSTPLPVNYMLSRQHQIVYAEDVLRMNVAAQGPSEGVTVNGRQVHILPVACTPDSREVGQLEMKREKLLLGMRDGARRVLQIFLPPMLERNKAQLQLLANSLEIETTTTITTTDENELQQIIEIAVDNIFPLSMLENSNRLQDIEKTITDQLGGNNQS